MLDHIKLEFGFFGHHLGAPRRLPDHRDFRHGGALGGLGFFFDFGRETLCGGAVGCGRARSGSGAWWGVMDRR